MSNAQFKVDYCDPVSIETSKDILHLKSLVATRLLRIVREGDDKTAIVASKVLCDMLDTVKVSNNGKLVNLITGK